MMWSLTSDHHSSRAPKSESQAKSSSTKGGSKNHVPTWSNQARVHPLLSCHLLVVEKCFGTHPTVLLGGPWDLVCKARGTLAGRNYK